MSGKGGGDRNAEAVKDRRDEINVPDVLRLPPRLLIRINDDQRDFQRRLVGKQAMRLFSMIAKRLAMVAGDDDKRVGMALQQRRQKSRQLHIDVCDFAEVWSIAVLLAIR